MAKCKYCGAEVAIGERCTYCGSKAESRYYPVAEKKQESKKKQTITLNAEYDDLGVGRKIFRGKYYIVQKGDNLWNIAKRFYGAGAEYYRIVRKNHLQDPNHIEVGQKLYL